MNTDRPATPAPCLAAGCLCGTDAPAPLCAYHVGLLSRSMWCAMRRAWRSRDPRTIANVTALAVREAQWRESMTAGKAV